MTNVYNHHKQDIEDSQKFPCSCVWSMPSFHPSPRRLLITFLFLYFCLFRYVKINIIRMNVAFCACLFSLAIIHQDSRNTVLYSSSLFLFIAKWCFIVLMYHSLLIHSPIDRYLGYLQIWAIMN